MTEEEGHIPREKDTSSVRTIRALGKDPFWPRDPKLPAGLEISCTDGIEKGSKMRPCPEPN